MGDGRLGDDRRAAVGRGSGAVGGAVERAGGARCQRMCSGLNVSVRTSVGMCRACINTSARPARAGRTYFSYPHLCHSPPRSACHRRTRPRAPPTRVSSDTSGWAYSYTHQPTDRSLRVQQTPQPPGGALTARTLATDKRHSEYYGASQPVDARRNHLDWSSRGAARDDDSDAPRCYRAAPMSVRKP
jgi:hypothetical protein